MKVIGTAGHVDHGKSTLVHTLTGIDPDRLAEEKAREMTIDLGFAWLILPSGEAIGVVDVPGHIDFIKNMLAGVGGIDLALFVIAADEGVMPQTREHLAILDLLQVPAGVVALTKVDLVEHDPEWLELVQADIAEVLDGTCLAEAPIVPVSARTGLGLDRLLQIMQDMLGHVPERRDLGRPRLPVDRAFTVAGFGTIVTGTLSDGMFGVGQEVEIVPSGLRARIRGLQTHKRKIERALPGSRVALNLSGVRKEEISRGDVVALPGSVSPTILVDVHLRLLADSLQELRHNQAVDFFCGAAEVEARTRLLGVERLRPGESGWVQLRLSAPVAIQRGDHFIVRQASPSRTLGGGVVVNPYPGRRWRRFRPEVIEMLEAYRSGDPGSIVLQVLRRQEPAAFGRVAAYSGLDPGAMQVACDELLAAGQLVVLDRDWGREPVDGTDAGRQRMAGLQGLITAEGWQTLKHRITEILIEYHRLYPLRLGMSREELKSRVQGRRRAGWSLRLFNDVMARAVAEGVLVDEGAVVRATNHQVELNASQQAAVDRLLADFVAAPYMPPSVAESVAVTGEDVFLWLVDSGRLIRVSEDVVFSSGAYADMLQQILAHLEAQGSITVAQVRDMFGTSRKYALALMEYLDSKRITRRVGDARVLRKG